MIRKIHKKTPPISTGSDSHRAESGMPLSSHGLTKSEMVLMEGCVCVHTPTYKSGIGPGGPLKHNETSKKIYMHLFPILRSYPSTEKRVKMWQTNYINDFKSNYREHVC